MSTWLSAISSTVARPHQNKYGGHVKGQRGEEEERKQVWNANSLAQFWSLFTLLSHSLAPSNFSHSRSECFSHVLLFPPCTALSLIFFRLSHSLAWPLSNTTEFIHLSLFCSWACARAPFYVAFLFLCLFRFCSFLPCPIHSSFCQKNSSSYKKLNRQVTTWTLFSAYLKWMQ